MPISSSLAWNFLDKSRVPDSEAIKKEFAERMNRVGVEGISVSEVDVDVDGEILVTFQDEDEDEMDVVFIVDSEDGPVAIIQDDDEDYEDSLIVDLDGLNPSVTKTVFGEYLNLTDLSWMNKSAFMTIFDAGMIDDEENERNEEDEDSRLPDPYGYISADEELLESDELLLEARKVYVIRGGKKVKLAIVRKKRKKVLTGKQKSAIRKAVRKRKAKKAVIKRKRKRSLRARKRMKIKRPKNLSRLQKVQGTANRRR